jgi:hypothetical protein
MPTEKRTIGRIDLIDLPEYAMTGLACKVDTGADTSSLHRPRCGGCLVQLSITVSSF